MAIQSDNLVELTGKVVEVTLREGLTYDKKEYVSGQVKIEVAEDCIVPVDFYQNKITKVGEENSLAKGFKTLNDSVKTISKNGRDEAQIVTITNGSLRENSYYDKGDRLRRGFSVSAIAFKEKSSDTPLENKFVVSGVVVGMSDEVINDLPTGKLFLDLLVIGYNNRGEAIQFVIEDPKGVAYAKTSISQYDEVKVAGNIVISEVQTTSVEEVAFGAPIENTKTIVQRKLVITSLSPAKESAIPQEERETILATREGRLQEAKAKQAAKTKSSAPAKSAGRDFSL